jgi:hypothetical protein
MFMGKAYEKGKEKSRENSRYKEKMECGCVNMQTGGRVCRRKGWVRIIVNESWEENTRSRAEI